MATSPKGKIALVPFPFSDLSKAKLPPAVVLSSLEKGDLILCRITSNPYSDPLALKITDLNFVEGSLKRISYVRPGKLFTSSDKLIENYAGTLNAKKIDEIIESVIRLLRQQ
ncbi:MAG: hypothetical protein BRD50_05015 [Bacteroidetes bacterium SW_11_45_7]|nr:MAG: hypothetical protein BRD50_05015 [Bacteroidetes bacterium SW_11_45_7]